MECIALNLAILLWSRRTFSFRSWENPSREAQLLDVEKLLSQTCCPKGGEDEV
jgi:hypothetical protein